MAQKTNTKPPKGTRDFLPADIRRREHVTRIIREVYESHGFLPLETPAFERLETLLGKYGEEGDQLVFKILHRGQPLVEGIREAHQRMEMPGGVVVGRSGETAPSAETVLADMGLRYDLTVPLARVYAEYQAKLPSVFRRYQIQPVWRADTPGKGRFREFYQCDVDVVGSSSPVVEAEVTGAVASCLEKLGFRDFKILINHRKLLRAFIELSGIDVTQESEAIIAIDKLDKVGISGVEAELETKGITSEQRKRLFDLVMGDIHIADVKKAVAEHEQGRLALDNLETVLSFANTTPAAERLSFSPTLARGLGYYTGAIFEIAVKDLAGSLGGGGRYDGLIGMFLGREVPACGFSIGLERILVVMEERGLFDDTKNAVHVLVAAEDEMALAPALRLAYTLRAANFRVELTPGAQKAGKVRKEADERHIPCVVLLSGNAPDGVNVWLRAQPEIRDRREPIEGLENRIRTLLS